MSKKSRIFAAKSYMEEIYVTKNIFYLAPKVAYNYLNRYKGLEFLNEHYDYEHTQALWQTQEALRTICLRNGGTL